MGISQRLERQHNLSFGVGCIQQYRRPSARQHAADDAWQLAIVYRRRSVTISNQCLTIPPDHPLAVELFDLLGLQKVLMDRMIGGRPRDQLDAAAFDLVNKEIDATLEKYRLERGGDQTCRVGLTYVNGVPVVKGRPCLTLH
jgi:hypothetical protein